MKKVLVTGGSGSVGINVIKLLLSEGKYEITVLDLNNKKTMQRLKKYRKRINIVYGDINDKVLIDALVKDHDIVINLASVMPPLGEFSSAIGKQVDYNGTKTIINAINKYNNNCYLMYASTTSMYDQSLSGSIYEKIKIQELSNFALNKFNTENLIQKKVKNYTIFRIPLILNDILKEPFTFNIKRKSMIEVSTNIDVASAFVCGLNYMNKINKKIYNIGMGKNGRLIYNDILNSILKYQGLSSKYILSRLFLEKDFYSPVLTDSDKLEELIHYRKDSLKDYYRRLKRKNKKRVIRKILAKPIILLKK